MTQAVISNPLTTPEHHRRRRLELRRTRYDGKEREYCRVAVYSPYDIANERGRISSDVEWAFDMFRGWRAAYMRDKDAVTSCAVMFKETASRIPPNDDEQRAIDKYHALTRQMPKNEFATVCFLSNPAQEGEKIATLERAVNALCSLGNIVFILKDFSKKVSEIEKSA